MPLSLRVAAVHLPKPHRWSEALALNELGTWRVKPMSKISLSVLSSVLLSTAATLPALAGHYNSHYSSPLVARIADRFAEPTVLRPQQRPAKPDYRQPPRPDSVSYTIVDEPDADPAVGYGTRMFGINESGQVSGQFVDSNGVFHAFLGTPNGGGFDFTPIAVKHNDTFGFLLNDKGWMFGTYVDSETGIENAWLRTAAGKLTTVEADGGSGGTVIQGLNNKGVSAGNYFDHNGAFRGFLRATDGTIAKFDDSLGGSGAGQGTNPIGINGKGEVSGIVFDSNDVAHGFIRSADGETFTNFDVPGAGTDPFQGTLGLEIEDNEWLTGAYIDSNFVSHGFLRRPDGGIIAPIDPPGMGKNPGQGVIGVEHLEKGWAVGEYVDADDVVRGFVCKKCETDSRKIVEFAPPGAADTLNVISSNREHKVVGSFHDESGLRHGFIRNP